jgi:hypothetical protein
MNAVETTTASPPLPPPAAKETAPSAGTPLPEPLLAAEPPADLVATLMALMEQLSELTLSEGEVRLSKTQAELDEQLRKLLDQVEQAVEAARRATEEKHHGGWLSDLVSSVADITGEVVGTVADFTADSVTTTFDAAANIAEGKNVLSSIRTELGQLVSNGDTADSVKSFTAAVMKVDMALLEFTVTLGIAMAEAAAKGQSVWEAVKDQAAKLWTTFRQEILENPKFWEVAGWIAKGASVALALMSGGTLAWLAVGVFLLCEADQRYGFIAKAVGKDAAPYVRLGLQLASAVLLGCAGAGADTWVQTLQSGAAVAQGGAAVYQGVRTIAEGHRAADELDRQADIQTTLNRMQRLERLIEEIVAGLEEESDQRKTTSELGTGLAQTQAAMNSAAIMRA